MTSGEIYFLQKHMYLTQPHAYINSFRAECPIFINYMIYFHLSVSSCTTRGLPIDINTIFAEKVA